MIQRKQTLYLLLSGILMMLMLFLPMAKVLTDSAIFAMDSTGFKNMAEEIVMPSWVLMGLNAVIILLSFVAIFLYNHRTLQMRMTMFNLILKPGFYALAIYYILNFMDETKIAYTVTPWVALPIIAMILDYLAHRGIAIDDRTIKYMDRLR